VKFVTNAVYFVLLLYKEVFENVKMYQNSTGNIAANYNFFIG